MANFGIRFAAPPPARRLATPHGTMEHPVAGLPRGMAARTLALAQRVIRGALQALDDAPYDLAWPPSPRAAAAWAEHRAARQAQGAGSARER